MDSAQPFIKDSFWVCGKAVDYENRKVLFIIVGLRDRIPELVSQFAGLAIWKVDSLRMLGS